jgi:hypothetical protein
MARNANGRRLGFHPGASGFDPRPRYKYYPLGHPVGLDSALAMRKRGFDSLMLHQALRCLGPIFYW